MMLLVNRLGKVLVISALVVLVWTEFREFVSAWLLPSWLDTALRIDAFAHELFFALLKVWIFWELSLWLLVDVVFDQAIKPSLWRLLRWIGDKCWFALKALWFSVLGFLSIFCWWRKPKPGKGAA